MDETEIHVYRQDGRSKWTQVDGDEAGLYHGEAIKVVIGRLIEEGKTQGIMRADDGPLFFWTTDSSDVTSTLGKISRGHPYRKNPYRRRLT